MVLLESIRSQKAKSSLLLLLPLVAAIADEPKEARCARALSIAQRSRCPSSNWKAQSMSRSLLREQKGGRPLVYVNVGANKGFAVAEFLQRFHDDGGSAPSNAAWYKAIRAIKPSGMFQCGMCSACKDEPPPIGDRYNVSVRVYAFELLKGNHWLLTKLFERYRVPGVAVNAAVSNYTGTAWAPTGVRTGQEWSSAEMGEAAKSLRSTGGGHATASVQASGNAAGVTLAGRGAARARKLRLAPVPSLTIDGWAASEEVARIDWLSIDAEGWDALILEGAASLLAARRVEILEFEYHSKGMWAATMPLTDRRDLKRVLSMLHGHGYTCFWQGDDGQLAQASGGAWCNSFEWRGHSNLVCAHRADLIEALRAYDCSSTSARSYDDILRCSVKASRHAGPRKHHRAAYADHG